MKEQKQQPTRVQRIIAWILTLVFVPTMFGFGAYGLISNREDIIKSVRFSRAKTYLTNRENPEFFEMLNARIRSLENALGDGILFKDELGYTNAAFQRSIGKRSINAGSEQLYFFENGQIYAMTSRETLAEPAEEIVELYEATNGEVPFLFSYINPQFYDGGDVLPESYAAVDTGEELADEVLGIAREAGIETLDSREFFKDSGFTQNELYLKTDMHWTTLAGLLTAQIYAEKINEMTGAELDVSKIQLDQFENEVYPGLFLGEYGQQVGAANSGLDDITLYWPKYETHLKRYTMSNRDVESEAEGSFKDALIKWDQMKGQPSVTAYAAYGLVERLEVIENLSDDCEDMTILMFRDSYSAPVGCFLSLLAKKVVMVDIRTSELSAMDYVKEYNPDMIVVSFSRQMMEDHHYTLDKTSPS